MDRADPIEIAMRQARTRTPALVPIRYGRMVRSPFAFFRGAAAIMAADLAGTPVSGPRAQLSGDAHLANFGVFAAPDRRLVFDANDFDETLPGPWERPSAVGCQGLGARRQHVRRRDGRLGRDLRLDARTCARPLGDRVAIAASLGAGDAFDRELAGFARTYADQNEHDHAALVRAVEAGVVSADPDR
jgi:hypothetical protein